MANPINGKLIHPQRSVNTTINSGYLAWATTPDSSTYELSRKSILSASKA
ncbi:MAG: hypothetical protein ACFCBU_03030 [Cyanophyceae cyanobacterium]